MFKKCARSFLESMGLLAIVFTILSLIFRDIMQIRIFHLTVCVLIPIHLFSFFTFQFKLFSKHIWIRRTIVMVFSACVMLTVNILFGFARFEANYIIIFSVLILLFILLSVFAYYIADKIELRNLEIINQKLADRMKGNEGEEGV